MKLGSSLIVCMVALSISNLSGAGTGGNEEGVASVEAKIVRFSSCDEIGEIIESTVYGRPPDADAFDVHNDEAGYGFKCKWSYKSMDDPLPGSTTINKDAATRQTSYITPELILQLDQQRKRVPHPELDEIVYNNIMITRAEHQTGGQIGTLEFKLYVWKSNDTAGEAEVITIVARFPAGGKEPPYIADDRTISEMFFAMLQPAL